MSRIVSVELPEVVYAFFESEAEARGSDISGFCAAWITDHWIKDHVTNVGGAIRAIRTNGGEPSHGEGHPPESTAIQVGSVQASQRTFDVATHFAGYPRESQEYAQRVVDEALKLPGVIARKSNNGRGIIFEPNFVSIEYLRRRRSSPGIALSLGAPKERYKTAPATIKRGRNPSYSWLSVDRERILEQVLPLLEETFVMHNPSSTDDSDINSDV